MTTITAPANPEPRTGRLGNIADPDVWLLLPTEHLRRLCAARLRPHLRYINEWHDVNGYGLHLAHPMGWSGNRYPRPAVRLDPARLP